MGMSEPPRPTGPQPHSFTPSAYAPSTTMGPRIEQPGSVSSAGRVKQPGSAAQQPCASGGAQHALSEPRLRLRSPIRKMFRLQAREPGTADASGH